MTTMTKHEVIKDVLNEHLKASKVAKPRPRLRRTRHRRSLRQYCGRIVRKHGAVCGYFAHMVFPGSTDGQGEERDGGMRESEPSTLIEIRPNKILILREGTVKDVAKISA